MECRGELASWRRAAARRRANVAHTFVVGLSDARVIDGSRDGNSARFPNHTCSPNCEAIQPGDRVFIHASPTWRPAARCSSTMRWKLRANPPMRSGNCTHAAGTHPGAGDPCSAPQMVDVDQPNDCCRGRRTPLRDPLLPVEHLALQRLVSEWSGRFDSSRIEFLYRSRAANIIS
ncbi:SET domain-containing protein-lysine N-methyltransferase [Paraburkholderia caribensis]|uniref:SET domain-containing protein-lysine N-methyltransferase n=1 Tax=Paraburkholderia caribensis TaxID=75105 RepID=UPI003F490DCE